MSTLASFIITAISESSLELLLSFGAVPQLGREQELTLPSAEPDNYDWKGTRAIALSDSNEPSEGTVVKASADSDSDVEKKDEPTGDARLADPDEVVPPTVEEQAAANPPVDLSKLQRTFVRACWISGIFSFIIAVVVPFPLFFSHYIFSRRFFEGWCGVSLAWVLLAGIFCMCVTLFPVSVRAQHACSGEADADAGPPPLLHRVLPVWESRGEIFLLARSTLRVVSGRTRKEQVVA